MGTVAARVSQGLEKSKIVCGSRVRQVCTVSFYSRAVIIEVSVAREFFLQSI